MFFENFGEGIVRLLSP